MSIIINKQLHFFYRDHQSDGRHKRIWREDWANDMFEIVSPVQFDQIQIIFRIFGIPLDQAPDE